MNVKSEIRRAIKHGIHLGLPPKEEGKFIHELLVFLIKKNNFCILDEKTKTITVSSLLEDLSDIYIHEGTLKIKPLAASGYFSVFMDVLEFVAKKHQAEIDRLEQDHDVGDESTEDDEPTEDDGDWWL
jgi:hypothetical protein